MDFYRDIAYDVTPTMILLNLAVIEIRICSKPAVKWSSSAGAVSGSSFHGCEVLFLRLTEGI
jgi:hypothetical protein